MGPRAARRRGSTSFACCCLLFVFVLMDVPLASRSDDASNQKPVAVRRGQASGLQATLFCLRFFIRQLYGTVGLAAGLARAMTQKDDKWRPPERIEILDNAADVFTGVAQLGQHAIDELALNAVERQRLLALNHRGYFGFVL
jgi:hypothetical protein